MIDFRNLKQVDKLGFVDLFQFSVILSVGETEVEESPSALQCLGDCHGPFDCAQCPRNDSYYGRF